MLEQPWVKEARKFIGLKEIKGYKHNPEIIQFWKDIKRGGIKDDETAWCSAFVGAMLERVGIKSTRHENSQSWLQWGVKLSAPVLGCIVVFTRQGGGHVGFVLGKDTKSNLIVLGGNQSDEVNIRAFSMSKTARVKIAGYRYPIGEAVPRGELPILKEVSESTKES